MIDSAVWHVAPAYEFADLAVASIGIIPDHRSTPVRTNVLLHSSLMLGSVEQVSLVLLRIAARWYSHP